jgi:hypothetical protein
MKNHMNIFVLKNTFKKDIHIPLNDKYFYKNRESKLDFVDRIVVLNDFFYRYRGSIVLQLCCHSLPLNCPLPLPFTSWHAMPPLVVEAMSGRQAVMLCMQSWGTGSSWHRAQALVIGTTVPSVCGNW